ncbi:transglycosylase SLT domain-containing protein (plasmid) [Skermanella rosea]|uniref:transglycosylase SLT domain-containing protein n=1 Tax=Skermanella rosea TaxID=1817965 RepID=UPI0019324568|nr:transglycosylase SLT domain-containing protein [Skermanella rosea]UEM08121.1 transglycosylase SLT domain-containing protein [Skermanella rosea]
MPPLPLTVAIQIALAHAPQVAPETVLAFAYAESALDPLAIHSNTERRSYAPATATEAAALARSLLAKGHSLDLGLMQINSANLIRTGLTVESAFDPAESVRAGGMILVEAYQRCDSQLDRLRCMASRYNTGHPARGIRNGYAARVWNAADQVVPAIRQAAPPAPLPPSQPPPPNPCGPPPPSWDGWAVAAYQQCLRRASSSQEPPK